MPSRPPSIRPCCGRALPYGERCQCERRRRAAHDARRPTAAARGYDDRWRKARAAFLADHQNCTRCGATATVVDHVIPHRGDKTLFWNKSNWQTMCKACHDSAKSHEERRK